MPPRRLAGLALAAIATAASPALANGRFPAAGQVVVDPKDPTHLVVRATYGLLSTRDRGATWGWICEEAVGQGANEDPAVAIASGGGVVAGLFEGLAVSRDGGCAWAFAKETKDQYVIDVAADRGDPARVLALASNGTGASSFVTQVFRTADGGGTWAKVGDDLPGDFLGLTLDGAPSDAKRIYVSGVFAAPDGKGALLRSKDGGATFERLDVPGSDATHLPYIAAVDPNDADTVYVRLSTDGADVALVTRDGGATFTPFHTATGALLAFAISPDGAAVLLGGETDGLWRGPTATLALERVSALRARCVAWTDDAVYACADEFTDGFTLGRSTDGGATFASAMHLGGVCGPLACAAGTSVASVCPERWPVTAEVITATGCGGGAGTADAGAGGAATGAGGTATTTTTPPAPAASGGDDGGGCAIGRGPGGLAAAAIAALGAIAARRRRVSRPSAGRSGSRRTS